MCGAMSTWIDPVNAIAAVASAIAAGAAYKATRQANATADTVARIERARHIGELTPQFKFNFSNVTADSASFHVLLEGPDNLGHLDELRISIRDDDMLHQERPGHGGATQLELDNFVWGPFRFRPRVDTSDEHGRGVGPFPLEVGAGRPLVLDRTRPGPWMGSRSQELWQRQYEAFSIRLVLHCRRGEYQWRLERHLPQPQVTPNSAE